MNDADKRKTAAALLSGLVCPGAGQLYNGDYVKGGALIAAVVALLSALVYKTWGAMVDAALSLPPEEILSNVFELAHSILEANRLFYDRTVMIFAVIWAYGIIDAYVRGGRSGRTGRGHSG